MTRRVALAAVLVGLFGYAFGAELLHAATCTGANPCKTRARTANTVCTARSRAAPAECAAQVRRDSGNGFLTARARSVVA